MYDVQCKNVTPYKTNIYHSSLLVLPYCKLCFRRKCKIHINMYIHILLLKYLLKFLRFIQKCKASTCESLGRYYNP